MDLILLRHGEAEDAADPADDAVRRLTDDGRKKLTGSLPQLRLLLDDKKRLVIWTSPLARARQTAEILRDCLAAQGLRVPKVLPEHEFIASGDWNGFILAAKTLDPASSLVLVGHEPYWGTWSQRLCSCLLPFKKAPLPALILTLIPGTRSAMASPSGKARANCNGLSSPESLEKCARDVRTERYNMAVQEPHLPDPIALAETLSEIQRQNARQLTLMKKQLRLFRILR